eukprot:jgi/Hompol1/5800/HPOL_004713-RA
MALASETIEEKCLGAVGANLNLTFTGEPPFWVDYIEEHSSPMSDGTGYTKTSSRKEFGIPNLRKPRHSMTLSPSEPGLYRYIFTLVGDANYPEGVPLENMNMTQIIHPHSSAQFVNSEGRFVRCIGDSVQLQVGVQGSGPWSLVYFVVHNENRTKFKQTIELGRSVVTLNIGNLDNPGIYLVDLAEITDVNGCTEVIGSSGVTIEVLPQRPTVNFQTTKPVHVIEGGRASLPISVTGKGPFEITYRGANSDIQTSRNGRDLEIFGAGTFELLGIKDAFCQGQAVEPRQLEVVTIAKPSLAIASDTPLDRALCMDSHDGFHFELTGRAPFTIMYEHSIQPDGPGKPEQSIKKIETSADTFPLVFDTSKPGLHTYRMLSVSDANYKNAIAVSGIEVRRKVNRQPVAQFEEPGEHVYQCSAQRSDAIQLGVRLTGVPPFQIILDRKHDNQPSLLLNISVPESALSVPKAAVSSTSAGRTTAASTASASRNTWTARVEAGTLEEQGRYTFSIEAVVDGTGCIAQTSERETPESKMSIHLADQAKISSSNPAIICLGDLLTYSLQGSPPFTITYTWNDVVQPPVVVADPMMTLWAGAPGEIVITRVCNAMNCCDEEVAKDITMHTSVKALPRAIVDGGQDRVDDIREGDDSEIRVEFVGEPPFSFTYSHSKVSAPSRDPKQDDFVTASVSDIMERSWRHITTQEGVFRVTAVHDRYCGYPRIIQTMQGANAILR